MTGSLSTMAGRLDLADRLYNLGAIDPETYEAFVEHGRLLREVPRWMRPIRRRLIRRSRAGKAGRLTLRLLGALR
jgi:hypothetical protein